MQKNLEFESILLSQIPSRIQNHANSPLRPLVLVVDDERIIADTLAAILELNGYAAMTAYDAQSALEIVQVIPPDLLISDVLMPGMSGVELAMALSQLAPNCKVLLFSGQAATIDLLAAARSAGFEFLALAKPVHPSVMLMQVSELVPRYASQYVA